MKKLITLIRQKDREEKSKDNVKLADAKADKVQAPSESRQQSIAPPNDLFWDDYSDVGYC